MFLVKWVRQFFDRPWYLYLCALLAALDIFVLLVPTDGLLITYVWAKPKEWIKSFIVITIGSALGALAMAVVIRYFGEGAIQHWLSGQETWVDMTHWIDTHGVWAMVLISGGPFPLQPGVILAALSGMSLSAIFFSTLGGRLIKYALFAYLSVKMPHILNKSRFIRHEIEEAQGDDKAVSDEKRVE